MIPDPFDATEAIAPSGQRAAKVFLLPPGADVTAKDLDQEGAVQVGWADPADLRL